MSQKATPATSYAKLFQKELELAPSFGSFLGYRQFDDRLEDPYDPQFAAAFMRLQKQYESAAKAAPKDDVDGMLLALKARSLLLENKRPFELLPLYPYQNRIVEFVYAQTTLYDTDYSTREAVDLLFKRYQCHYHSMGNMLERMREGMRKGVTIPKMACEEMIEQLNNFIETQGYVVKVRVSPAPKDYIDFVHGPYKQRVEDILRFLREEYLATCKTTVGMCALPDGKEWYKELIKTNICTSLTPEEIHRLGTREVKRIRGCFAKLQRDMGFSGSLRAFIKHMTTHPTMFYTSQKQVIAAFEKARATIRTHLLPRAFHDLPREPYTLSAIPTELGGSAAGAFYYPPSFFGRKGAVSIDMADPVKFPKCEVGPLSLHEGEPGHHYQYQVMMDQKIPIYRLYGWAGCTFTEGWGLYVEKYLEELVDRGLMERYHLFGRFSYEMMRAVRLVVDTGVHYYGWSYSKALRYMKKHVPLREKTLTAELMRYICSPTQALCYKVGEYEFKCMYRKFVKEKGVDVKDFHREVLRHGAIPMNILWKILDRRF